MDIRPKIVLSLSSFDKVLERSGFAGIIILWFITIYAYMHLPATIPIHFNFSGQPDNYGSKATLILLSVLCTLIYYGLTKLNRYPHIFNYPTKITEANARQQYTDSTRLLRILKISIVFIFNSIILISYLSINGEMNGPGPWFLAGMFVLLLGPTVYYIIRSFKTGKTS